MAYTDEQYQAQVLKDVGDTGQNGIYEVILPVEATGGDVTLTFGGEATTPLGRYALPAIAQAAVEALPNVGDGNVRASYGVRGWRFEFISALGAQPLPALLADGSELDPPGTVTVKPEKGGAFPYLTSARIAEMWSRRSTFSATPELRYLWVRLDAIIEFKGFTWTQINQKTGDEQKDYQDQFDHLVQMEESTREEIEGYGAGAQSTNYAVQGQTLAGSLTTRTPSGVPYPFSTGRQRGQY